MKILLTGGAGFIGSCLLRMLNDSGIDDVVVVDNIASTRKWMYLSNKRYTEYIHKDSLWERLPELEALTHVIHMGACSNTAEENFDYLYYNNYEFSKKLFRYCTEHNTSLIYASSAATYGSGDKGFSDSNDINSLLPLNGYGYSKQMFDVWVERQSTQPKQCVGLKFFNVYGPNEYHKGSMASVVYHGYKQAIEQGSIKLFKSYNPRFADGAQLRDFVYVKDICKVIKFFIEHTDVSGLFNVGTGCAESFETLGISVFKALGLQSNIEYIPMPESLRGMYQYYTEASVYKLRKVGYEEPFHPLEQGVADYVCNYLDDGFKIW